MLKKKTLSLVKELEYPIYPHFKGFAYNIARKSILSYFSGYMTHPRNFYVVKCNKCGLYLVAPYVLKKQLCGINYLVFSLFLPVLQQFNP